MNSEAGHNCSTGNLLVTGQPAPCEQIYGTIKLTDKLREMDGIIIECGRVDNQRIFHHLRTDREHPNAGRTIKGCKPKILFYLMMMKSFS